MKKYTHNDMDNIRFFLGDRFKPAHMSKPDLDEMVQLYDDGKFSQLSAMADRVEVQAPWKVFVESPVIKEAYHDLVTYGTAVVKVEEEEDVPTKREIETAQMILDDHRRLKLSPTGRIKRSFIHDVHDSIDFKWNNPIITAKSDSIEFKWDKPIIRAKDEI